MCQEPADAYFLAVCMQSLVLRATCYLLFSPAGFRASPARFFDRPHGLRVWNRIIPHKTFSGDSLRGTHLRGLQGRAQEGWSGLFIVGDSSIQSQTQSLQIQKILKVALCTLCTASHNHTPDICQIVCT